MRLSVREGRPGRVVVAGVAALGLLGTLAACGTEDDEPAAGSATADARQDEAPGEAALAEAAAEFEALEGEFDARLGVYALDTGTGAEVAHRDGERFAYASAFKALLVGAVLDEYGTAGVEEVVDYTEDELVDYSPVTENFVDSGMSLSQLSAATLWYSDNTAANLLLEAVGGPAGLQEALREMGDDTTEVSRYEPELNEATPGDTRDTSTPRAMAEDLRALLLADALGERERHLLRQWMETNTTGGTLVRAGLPAEWTVADKSGSAGYGGRNNIAVVWPDDGGDPIVLAVLSSRDEEDAERDDALIARAATAAVTALGRLEADEG
ncbi:beta-lactamase class A [Streptomyces zhaozhouensis]|uniref:Beta-lactamase class A n=1 Tax=Streptomyces zhaozhouensis TaxID=1300267 RepID=A0A286E5G1_9ACTN|nr:class A beta-lactamase [Streptomyces zhaozhouensis]SOD66147.1 beta-lactamase class A [Streptomyces zhaozhouensis]